MWRTVQRTSLLFPMLFVGVYQVNTCMYLELELTCPVPLGLLYT